MPHKPDDLEQVVKNLRSMISRDAADLLMRAIRCGVLNFELDWAPHKYASERVEDGEILTKKERLDLERSVYNSIKNMIQ